ncbi:MAG: 50S ribosomal protein L17 [Candidatus Komeilibacteria bacterium RIFCSPLOWO2_01_FULL_52_15]|uniref:Large ribosomal subunit protein bL17 n=2 Tax=Candidatus Komeiliibacteriota TaxID=1817908 RepID=A0A1G2BQF4_9BACT|nr:MAG: 50S ribosomal protein L17 [Candidatus Komeilibacteria bacterium RIFCSPHIGHO2_01_FULL_52_14]OGY90427.1 MAG: 50S ribosomal protein L17 [Candidatus Komeilibacteria bacterium RIFCSPLOWO2_01_FULL_52_15]
MRHRKKRVKLGRESGPRRALLKNLATQVILYEKVRTTQAKAKAIRPIVEKIITRGKVKSVHTKRMIGRYIRQPKAVMKVLDVLGPRYKDRKGGYTRIIKMGQRAGDGAPMVSIEFV